MTTLFFSDNLTESLSGTVHPPAENFLTVPTCGLIVTKRRASCRNGKKMQNDTCIPFGLIATPLAAAQTIARYSTSQTFADPHTIERCARRTPEQFNAIRFFQE